MGLYLPMFMCSLYPDLYFSKRTLQEHRGPIMLVSSSVRVKDRCSATEASMVDLDSVLPR